MKLYAKVTVSALILGILMAAPKFMGAYMTVFFFITLMYITLSLSYDIMGGMTGYLNFGHCTFFGIGAYAFGIFYLRKFALLLCFTMPVLIVIGYAAFISFPLFRIKGVYFALATIGLVRLIEQLAMNLRFLTDGSAGLSIVTGQQLYSAYYMTLTLASIALFTNYIIMNSKFGLALNCIREDEDVARSFGINSYLYKALALMISSAFSGLMGAIYIFYITYITPDTVFGIELIFSPAIMAMLGGTGTLFGPLIGAVFITFLQELIWSKLTYLHLATYGIIFALVGYFMPGGIMREPKVRTAFSRIAKLFRT